MESAPRQHETVIEIEAGVDEVWRAITEARELERWFAPRMTVKPGVGGEVIADWGPGLVWRTRIEEWDEGRRLVLSEVRDRVMSAVEKPEKLTPMRLVQDYTLEAREGMTVLRLVHSGFGVGPGWDNEYEGTRGGWRMCFGRLKVGLELHKGQSVRNSIENRVLVEISPWEILERLAGRLPEGAVLQDRAKFELTIRLERDGGSCLGISAQPVAEGSVVYLEFLLYGVDQVREEELKREWLGILDSVA